jgi:hypothetical protein
LLYWHWPGHNKEVELQVNSFSGDYTPSLWLVFRSGTKGDHVERRAFFRDYVDWEQIIRYLADAIEAKAYFTVLRGMLLYAGIDNDASAERDEITPL